MAEEKDNACGSKDDNNWLGSWITAAKNKSCEVLEFVKKDLEEFGSAVKSEASNVVTSTGTVLEKTLKLDEPESTVNSMKRSISSFIGQMNEVLSPSPDDSDTEAIMIIDGQETVKLTKSQKAVYDLQNDEKTFTEDPEESLKPQYESWLSIIEDQLSEERLSKHLMKSVTLKNQYTALVPLKVEHGVFWRRYLFKKALMEDDLAREEAMAKREAKERKETIDNVKWDEGAQKSCLSEDFAKDIELSEEEQTKLLEQYENETKLRSNKKSPTKGSPKGVSDVPLSKELNIATNSSSNSSSDGDWEKISE